MRQIDPNLKFTINNLRFAMVFNTSHPVPPPSFFGWASCTLYQNLLMNGDGMKRFEVGSR